MVLDVLDPVRGLFLGDGVLNWGDNVIGAGGAPNKRGLSLTMYGEVADFGVDVVGVTGGGDFLLEGVEGMFNGVRALVSLSSFPAGARTLASPISTLVATAGPSSFPSSTTKFSPTAGDVRRLAAGVACGITLPSRSSIPSTS